MAKYDRRLLVPYLQDVCSVELLCTRTARDLESCKQKLNYAQQQANRTAEYAEKPNLLGRLAWVLCGIVIITILGILVDKLLFPPFLFVLIVGFFIPFAAIYLWHLPGDYRYDMTRYKRYKAEQAAYDDERAHHRNIARIQESKLVLLRKRLDAVQQLRRQVYSVDIIPNKYRNPHAAYYLFDYFKSCREDDLDKIIQTMLLDDIIKRLDRIISQNEEIILNQRYQSALQEQQSQMTAANHHAQMNAIARMEADQQRQIDYQRMIAQNQAVTNFFLSYDFFSKKR